MAMAFLEKHGGYRKLKSFQVAQIVYDITEKFCESYIEKRSRTRDQMVQAARSGVQNIAEGSLASATSKKTELKLTGVARASLEELRLDYEDFLRQRGLPLWPRSDARRADLIARRPQGLADFTRWVEDTHASSSERHGLCGPHGQVDGVAVHVVHSSTSSMLSMSSTPRVPRVTYREIAANGVLALIAVACSLLDRQLASLARAFESKGGFTERLYQARRRFRGF